MFSIIFNRFFPVVLMEKFWGFSLGNFHRLFKRFTFVNELINISEIRANISQPRKNFKKEELEELASSIKSQGVLQPILVRATDNNQYEIIAGERRWRAAQIAGIHEIPTIIKETTRSRNK